MTRRGIAVAALATALTLAACGTAAEGDPVRIGVPPGSALSSIGDTLVARGVLTSDTWFKLLGRVQGIDRSLRPGYYDVRPGSTAAELLDQFRRGDEVRFRITLPEGGTVWDFARAAERGLGIPADTILALVRDPEIRQEFGIEAPTVEGWLHPDTYFFGGYATPREVVRRFLIARRDAWSDDWQQRATAAGLSKTQVVILASIVEAEARLQEELPRIAAVYRNRLRIGMPLQADPTIQYAFLLDRNRREPRLFNRDYSYQSPYNTYLVSGLPPTPIGNPSDAAIEATLSPIESNELYFVARGDGGHVFAATYTEHLRNIRRIRSQR
jgi:UPF0755 protein